MIGRLFFSSVSNSAHKFSNRKYELTCQDFGTHLMYVYREKMNEYQWKWHLGKKNDYSVY